MSPSIRAGLCATLVLAWTGSLAAAAQPPAAAAKPAGAGAKAALRMFDVRVSAGELAKALADPNHVGNRAVLSRTAIEARAAAMRTGLERLRQEAPGATFKISQATVAPSSVLSGQQPLTAAASGAASEDIVRSFLSAHADIYGLSAADLGDLVVLGDSPGGRSGLRMLRLEQQIGGRPIFQSETRFVLDREGRLQRTLGQMVPNARALAPAIDRSRLLSAPEAVARLLASVGKTGAALAFTVSKTVRPGTFELDENDDYVAGAITAREVLFPLAPGVLVPAWSLVVSTGGDEDWYAMVDAETGGVLWRKNIRNSVSTHDARFRVYVQADGVTPADSPAPQSPNTVTPGSGTQFAEITATVVSMFAAQDIIASPNGWIDDCPAGVCATVDTNTSTEQTVGNNVRACTDRTVGGASTNQCDIDAASQLDTFGKPRGNPDSNGRNRDFLGTTPRDFQTTFAPPPQGGAGAAETGQTATGAGNGTSTGPTDIFRRGSVTQHFYGTNWYHDQLFQYGFDEASANFQNTNFSGMGLGGDRVLMDVQDGSGTNNANFATPPDGTSGRSQMFRFTFPTIDRDGGLDTEILIHELTHGTSNRLVGNAAGLNWDPAGGMGEGWSDFYALAMLNNTNADDPDGQYGSGGYATFKLTSATYLDNYLYGIRRFPYSTDNTVNPMTWADVDDVTNNLSGGIAPTPLTFFNNNGGMEVHNSGELWALSLWEVRSRIIADPAGANGDVPTGNTTTLQLVTDALKMTPIDPSFTEGRDALFGADCATNACANEDSIWGGFADRGLGYGAKTPYNVMFGFIASHLGVHESFSVPFLDVVDPANDVTINDVSGNNNGAIDPGEPILLTVELTNPWRAASKAVAGATATLTSSTIGVNIFDNASTYGAIAPLGTATGDSFFITLDPTVVCGSAIDFTLTTTSSLGTTATTFRVRIGTASGTDPVVTYTGDPSPDLSVPDALGRGVFTTLNVTDDFEIADLDFRMDSATHDFAGDFGIELRSPGDIGTDFISLIDGLNDFGGVDIVNMVIDDDLPSTAANDMVQAVDTDAPYTKSWLPVFNSPWTTLAFGLPADTVGNLSRYDGTSTLGTWTLLASDQVGADVGTINSWSILVTPVHFACTPFAASAIASATKTVTGAFTVGGTVTYTVTITNTGTDAQGDNAGNEFTDTLPAGLTLVSAVSTSGTATANVNPNEVTWNGSLAPLGGSVTITITATINAGTQGTTISNQGSTLFDGNNDNVNEAAGVTDDPSVGGATDPTNFVVGSANLTATKTVSAGPYDEGDTITYTIIISNSGSSASTDNAGNEFTDTLPAGLTVLTPTASSGTVSGAGVNPVLWNGSVPASGSVTITIPATINVGAAGSTLTNQGTVSFDADLNGSNESTVLTDDPSVGGVADPTQIVVTARSIAEIPTLSEAGLLTMVVALVGAAWLAFRRRRATV